VAAPIPRIECLATRQFLVAYSAAPSTPQLFFYAGSGGTTAVHCGTVVTSDTTHFNSFITFGNSPGLLLAYFWIASFTSGPVRHPGYIHLVSGRP